MVWKKLLIKLGLFLARKGLKWAFKNADKNKDGVLTNEEVWNFGVDILNKYFKK